MRLFSFLIPLLFSLFIAASYAFPQGLHAVGNRIVDSSNNVVHLHGVSRSSTEYACVQGWGFSDNDLDLASIRAMKAWNINAVRVPLNEHCWRDLSCPNPKWCGTHYHTAIKNWVHLITSNGMAAILDLQWTAPGSGKNGKHAAGLDPMPNMDNTPAFWKSVASMFKDNTAVIFDLFNEPFPDNNQDSTKAWECWKNGGSSCSETSRNTGEHYQVAGMQTLVNAVRSTGAKNLIILGGVQYSNALANWARYKPNDPENNLAASWHSYNDQQCNYQGCWDSNVAAILNSGYPIVTGEIGQKDCGGGYIGPLMRWLDQHSTGYLAWTWNTWGCTSGPCVIDDYQGTPTRDYGKTYHDHIKQLHTVIGSASPSPPSPTTHAPSPVTAPPSPVTAPPSPVTAPPSPSSGSHEVVIFDETAQSPEWANWSWGKAGTYVVPTTDRAYTGSHSALLYPCEFNALRFQLSGSTISSASYPMVSFYVYAENTVPKIWVQALIDSSEMPQQTKTFLESRISAPNQWVHVVLDMQLDLGVPAGGVYNGIWFQSSDSYTQCSPNLPNRLFFDNIRLIEVTPNVAHAKTNNGNPSASSSSTSSTSSSSSNVVPIVIIVAAVVVVAALVAVIAVLFVRWRVSKSADATGSSDQPYHSLQK